MCVLAHEEGSGAQVAGQQALRAQEAQERAAAQKLQRAKDDQAHRVEALQQQAETAETKVGCSPGPCLSCVPFHDFDSTVVLLRGCWRYSIWPTLLHVQMCTWSRCSHPDGLHHDSDARQLCYMTADSGRYYSMVNISIGPFYALSMVQISSAPGLLRCAPVPCLIADHPQGSVRPKHVQPLVRIIQRLRSSNAVLGGRLTVLWSLAPW